MAASIAVSLRIAVTSLQQRARNDFTTRVGKRCVTGSFGNFVAALAAEKFTFQFPAIIDA
jgi:hypothetical protein